MSTISPCEYDYGGVRCSFKDCYNTAFNTRRLIPVIRYYSYPTKFTNRCKEWIIKSGRDDFFDLEAHQLRCRRVCSRHFTPSQMIGMRLYHDAIPCVYYRDPNAAANDEDSRINCQRVIKLSEGDSIEVTRSSDVRYYRPVPTSRRKPLETCDSKQALETLDSNIDCETSNDRHVLENQIKMVGGPQNVELRQGIMSVREISSLFSGCSVPYKLMDYLSLEPPVMLHIEESIIKMEPIEYDDAIEATDCSLYGSCDQLLQPVETVTVKMEPIDYDDAIEPMDSLLYGPCDPLLQVEKDTVRIEPIEYNDAVEFTDNLLYGPPDPLLQKYSKQSSTILKTSFHDKCQQSSSLCHSNVEKVTVQMEPTECNDAIESTESLLGLYNPPESFQQVEEVTADVEPIKYNNVKEQVEELENNGINTKNYAAIGVDEYFRDDYLLGPDRIATKNGIHSVTRDDPIVESSAGGDDSIESTAQCSKRIGGMSQRQLQMKRKHSGLSHITRSGKILKATEHFTIFQCCKRNCHDLLTADEQRTFYNLFWQSGDKQIQDKLLADSMKAMPVVRRKASLNLKTRKCSWHYLVPKEAEKIVTVCRELFCKILQINTPRLASVQDRLMRGESLMVENRGKYPNRPNKITQQVHNMIERHWKDYQDGAIIIEQLSTLKLYQSFRQYYFDICGCELSMKLGTYYAYYLQKKNCFYRPQQKKMPVLLKSTSDQRKHRRKDCSSSESDSDSSKDRAYDHNIDIKINEIKPSSNLDTHPLSGTEKKETESKIMEEEPTLQTDLNLGTGTSFADLTNKDNVNCVGTSTVSEIDTAVKTTVDPDITAYRSVTTCHVVPEAIANGDDSDLLDFFPYGRIDEDLTAVFANYFTASYDDFSASDDDEAIDIDSDDVHLRSRTYRKQLSKRVNWPRNSIQLQNLPSESTLCEPIADVCSSTDCLKLDWPLPGDSNFMGVEQQLVDRFIANGCGCTTVEGRSCSRLLNADELLKYRQESAALDHYENQWNKLSLAVLGQLKALTYMYTSKSGKSGQKAAVNYMLNGLVVCKRTFLFANRMKIKRFKRLISVYKLNGLFTTLHRNSEPSILSNISDDVINFLHNYASQSAVLLSSLSENEMPIQILPNCNTSASIFSQYRNLVPKISTLELFKRTWKACCPEIVVGHPSTNICRVCSENTNIVNKMALASVSVKFQALENYRKHLEAVEEERENYRETVKMSKESMNGLNGNIGQLPNPSCCFSGSCHYSIGVVQKIHVPANPAEPRLSLLKPYQIGIFGIMCDSVAKQCSFLVPESLSATITPNTVVSMLHYYFENYGYGEQNMYLHADNGIFVSKNNILLCYLSWRILKGLNKTINLSILPQGHSRLSCDLAFALFKDTFRKRFASSLNDVCNIMNESTSNSKLNFAVPTGTETGDILVPTYDWESHFSKWQLLTVCDETRYSHFHFSAEWPGKVKCKVRCKDESVVHSVNMNLGMDHQSMPPEVVFTGLSNARKKYLFDNVREYCSPESKDALCPKLDVKVIDDDHDMEVTLD